jgi:hypothetical protein
MNTKTTRRNVAAVLFALLLAFGCSKESSDSSGTGSSDSNVPDIADKKMTAEIDKDAEEVLQSSDITEAADWVKKYPKSELGEDEDGKPILLSTIVARLNEAGAKRIVIESAKLGQAEFLESMVVVLPDDPAARKKLFDMDEQLSDLAQETRVIDRGQKYLHYSFD